MKTRLLVLILCFFCQFTIAQEPAKRSLVQGRISCGAWLSLKSEAGLTRGWLIGFLSGLNMGIAVNNKDKYFNFWEKVDIDQVFLWMNNFCKSNPLENAEAGGIALFLEVREKYSN